MDHSAGSVPNRDGRALRRFITKRGLSLYGERSWISRVSGRSIQVLRSDPILLTQDGVSRSPQLLRAEHRLVARAFNAAQAADARRILLVSAHLGDGKTHFARCVQRHASAVTDEPFEIEPFGPPRPRSESSNGYVWVDGVALLEGDGAAVLAPAVRASVDGALLVARGMVTTRAEVADCAAQLRTLGMRVLGGIWNDFDCPPPAETLRTIRTGLRTWPPQLPPGVFTRQFRWWS